MDLELVTNLIGNKNYALMTLAELRCEEIRLKTNFDRTTANVGKLQLLTTDINHTLELDNLSGADMLKLASKLKSTLKLRRIFKDQIEVLGKLISAVHILANVVDIKKRCYKFRIARKSSNILRLPPNDLFKLIKINELV